MTPLMIKCLIAASGAGITGISIWGINTILTPKTIQEKLEKEGYGFHPFGDDNNLDGWKSLAKKYGDNSSSSGTGQQNRFSELTLTNSQDQNNVEDAKKLREACKKLAIKAPGGEDYESDAAKLKAWCVVQGEATTKTTTQATKAS